MSYTIRSAKVEDAAALQAIYAPYVTDTAITFEYDAPSIEEFERRIKATLEKFPYLVLEAGGQIAGYCYVGTFKARPAYSHCVETSIYIKMGEHGKGYGRALYTAMEEELRKRGFLNACACITSPKPTSTHLDNGSQKFHEKMGYTLVGTFHDCGYKFHQWYNMIWMEKMLGEHK